MGLKSVFFTLYIAFLTGSFSQGTLRGVVKSDKDGNALPFAKVVVVELEKFAATDSDGLFSIPKLPAGTYTVKITSVGFAEHTESVQVNNGNITTIKVDMIEGKTLGVINIDHKNKERHIDPGTSVTKITKQDILRVPVTGGVADIATYFQTVPGVITTGDQGGQFYVRGGTPIQNKILLDGMTIYNPFHSIGFFSVFETELIRSADIYTGGFSAKYGGRISSVMDITYRDGNTKKFSGMVGVSPFTSNILLEGPISKKQNISFILAGKAALLEQTAQMFYPYINRDSIDTDDDGIVDKDTTFGLPFNFWDLYGKVSIQGVGANKVSFFGFGFNDKVTYQAVSNLQWNSYGGGSNFVFVPEASELFVRGRFNISKYAIALSEENLADRTSGILGSELAFDFTYYLPNKSKLDYGFGFNYFQTEFSTFNSVNRLIEQNDNTIEAGLYLNYRVVGPNKRLIFEPGFRLQTYSSVGVVSPEPRLSLKFNISEQIRFKAAGGRFTQNFTSTTDDKDVVNLFYGFITAPTNLPEDFVTPGTDGPGNLDIPSKERQIKNGLQKAWHAIGGFEFDLSKKMTLQLEGYYKWFTQVTNINSNKIFVDNAENSDIADVFKKDFIVESGAAYGGDVVFNYSGDKLYFWAVYSLQKVTRWNGYDFYAPVFDRRHNINLVASYSFGKDKAWEVTARWNLGSGLPFKQTNGVYETPVVGEIDDDYWNNNAGALTFLYEDGFTGRLPSYHRLDINMKRTLKSEKWKDLKLDIVAGVTNVYSRQNIFYVNRVTNEKVYQLPVMPSIALSMKF